MLHSASVRTTVNLDDDVAAAVARARRERSLGLSEAVNELVRAGLVPTRREAPFRQETRRVGIRIDVTNVSDALELLEGPTAR